MSGDATCTSHPGVSGRYVVKDYYSLLSVNPDATVAQIDAAYRRLMQKHHPNARSSPLALERMREMNEAWRVLSDANQRAAYDRARAAGTEYQPPAPPPTLRNIPQANLADFGARRSSGGTCLVVSAVAIVLVFALGILAWGLNERLNFNAMFERAVGEINALLPTRIALAIEQDAEQATPTPDPRCRDGCETPPPGCVVKGDVENDGTRYFYLPNDEGYARIVVEITKGDRWFCALNDAQAAGWTRKAPTETPTLPPPPEALTTPVARRAFVACGENVTMHQGPGAEYPVVQNLENGARLAVTGVNGDWSVTSRQEGVGYVRTLQLCAPPPSAAKPSTAPAPSPGSTPLINTPAVANSAAPAYKYPAPQLVVPTNGARYWCTRELVLEWDLAGPPLAEGEYFLVENKRVEHDRWFALADWTKSTTVTLFPNRGGGECDALWWANTGVYEWRVSVVTGSKEMPTHLSPFSEGFHINYAQ